MSAANCIPLADAFRFCPRCGNHGEQPGANPFVCSSCDFVFYFSPIAAVGAILANPAGEILFIVRGKDPGKGKLGLPGGFVDPGEPLEASLVREVLEETALRVVASRFLCSRPNHYRYRGVEIEVVDSFFVSQVESFEPLTAQPGEVQSFRRVRPDAAILDQIAFRSNREAVEVYLNAESPPNA